MDGFQKNGWCRKLVPKTEEPKRPFFGWYNAFMETLETAGELIVARFGFRRPSCIQKTNKTRFEKFTT
jgi:hypothetical protein